MLKLYAMLVLVLGIGSLGVAVWGTWNTVSLIVDIVSAELFRTDYWVGLTLFWVIGIAGITSGIGMLRHSLMAARLWEIFSWVLAVTVVFWAVLDTLRANSGIDNLIEVAFFVVFAILATLVRWREKHHDST